MTKVKVFRCWGQVGFVSLGEGNKQEREGGKQGLQGRNLEEDGISPSLSRLGIQEAFGVA